MGLCKDCFHRAVCETWATSLTTMSLDDIPPEIPCGHFKDTADVAPRAEVAREIFGEVRNILCKHDYARYQSKDGDECDEVTKYLSYVAVDFDRLEQKYKEDNQ